ncbi:MAG: hypothetical protein ACRDOH_30945, partial [Streptosporangiaceae bacterium]
PLAPRASRLNGRRPETAAHHPPLNGHRPTAFPVQGCAVTRAWAAVHPRALAAFRAAFEQGQQIADANRAAAEQAMGALAPPLGLTGVQAAVMALDSHPVGPVDAVRIQRVADVMRQFPGFPRFSIRPMLTGG